LRIRGIQVTGGKASELTVDEIVVVVLGVGFSSGEDVHFLILSQSTFHPLIVISTRKAQQIYSPIRKKSIRHDQPTTPMEKLPISRSNTTEANDGSEEAFNTGLPTSITVSSLLAGLYGILQADTLSLAPHLHYPSSCPYIFHILLVCGTKEIPQN
jgi:hypothetical protein